MQFQFRFVFFHFFSFFHFHFQLHFQFQFHFHFQTFIEENMIRTVKKKDYRNDQNRSNLHTAMHYDFMTKKYSLPNNCNVLINENKHRYIVYLFCMFWIRKMYWLILNDSKKSFTTRIISMLKKRCCFVKIWNKSFDCCY